MRYESIITRYGVSDSLFIEDIISTRRSRVLYKRKRFQFSKGSISPDIALNYDLIISELANRYMQ